MGAWGTEAWDNDEAADWFSEFFAGIDVDARIDAAFAHEDDCDRIRAACHLLGALGRPYVWPGDLERLESHLERGIALLSEMIEQGSEFRDLWEDDPDAITSVRTQLTELTARLSGETEGATD